MPPNDVFGEIGLLADHPRTASATALKDSHIYRIAREDFETLLAVHPQLNRPLRRLMETRDRDLVKKSLVSEDKVKEWEKSAAVTLKDYDLTTTSLEIHRAVHRHGEASLGIWLGILLDGIPESLVIGLSVQIDRGLPWALVAGVFLSNLPEALSSSALMLSQRYSRLRILLMWSSITVMTAVGALIGNVFFQDFSRWFVAVIEGMAAGAMLTMISETMLPEAYERGGIIVGLSTLAGFLAALLVKSVSS